ncbi:hypothetical protein [Spirillospora sp. CA-128828]|uniref:hypothetical protein n=1 Tax=Spirillospora sp. CA-128828 TaxID=3240033 RepID=UPI003D8D4DEE
MGIEHTSGTDTHTEAIDKPTAQGRPPGLRPDNPGSPGQPSRLESLARARELPQEQNGSEKTDVKTVPSQTDGTGEKKDAPQPSGPEQNVDEPKTEPVNEKRRTEGPRARTDEDPGDRDQPTPGMSEPPNGTGAQGADRGNTAEVPGTEAETDRTKATEPKNLNISEANSKDGAAGQVPHPVRGVNDDLSAWMAATEQIVGKGEPASPADKASANDTGEKIEVAADRLDIPEDLRSQVEYGRPQGTNEDGAKYELPLFDEMPKREDAMQGALGDCGVIAAIGAVAGTSPDKIHDSVRDNNDGTVTVALHEAEFRDRDVTAPTGRVIDVTMSKDIPVFTERTNEAAFARCTRAGVTWPGYIEKALGAVDETWPPDRGQNPLVGNPSERGYARLDKGTGAWTQAEILTQLTGRAARVNRLDTDPGAVADNEAVLTDLVESERPSVFSTLPDSMQRADPDAYKLRCQHAYELIGVENGKVLMRNPYGHKHPDAIPVAEFSKYFNSYYAALEDEAGGQ